tara:strand:+ start:3773 stop:4756 length:984 start_codon:yes stop_codon:yes gene_type:complete
MKVIVTGGAGFIGSHLVDKLLSLNFDVIVLDNLSTGRFQNLDHIKNKIKFVECSIDLSGDWTKNFEGVDWVIHLAALADIVPSIQKPESYFQSNVTGTFNILEASRKYGIKKFVYAASSSCYGIPNNFPTSEEEKISPQYPYALTKYLGEELALHWSKVYKLPCISLRLFNVYGPRSRTSGTYGAVFGVFLAQKLAGKPFTVVGDGKQTRDFTFVSDVVNAIVTSAKNAKIGSIYNVGSGKTVSVNELVDLLGGEKINIPKRPGEPDCTHADISKISRELNWEPLVSFEDGVKELLKNIKYWQNAPVWTPESIREATNDWFKYLGKQ